MFNKKFFKSFFQKRATLSSTILILGLVLGIGVSFVLAQGWQEPTATPPGDNVAAPINVSATEQRKVGPLRINNYLIAGRDSNDNIIPNIGVIGYGNVLGGMFNTSDKYGYIGYGDYGGFFIGDGYFSGQLIIDTKVTSPEYCIDGDCITSWPSGGGGAVNCSDCNDTFVNENQNNSITTDMLEDNSVTNIKIDGDSVNTANITNNTILWEDFDTILQNNLSGSGATPQDLYGVLTETFHTGWASDASNFTDKTWFGGDVKVGYGDKSGGPGGNLYVGNPGHPTSPAGMGYFAGGLEVGTDWGEGIIVYNGGVRIYGSMQSPEGTPYGLEVRGSGGGKGDARINNDLRVGGMITNRQPGYGPADRVGEVILDVLDANTIEVKNELAIDPVSGWISGGTTDHGDLQVATFNAINITANGTYNSSFEPPTCDGGVITACEISANIKNFIQPHPTDPEKEIVYTTIEGRDARVYFDGVAKLTHGKAVIKVPEDFRLVASEITPLNVILTPFGPASLYAASRSLEEIAVQEKDGNSDAEFGYMVITDRAGYENRKAIRENTHFKK